MAKGQTKPGEYDADIACEERGCSRHDGRGAPRTAAAGLFARDGVIEQVGPTRRPAADGGYRCSTCPGRSCCPGLINCHHHLDQTLTRNLPAGQNTNLFPWLRAHYRIWARPHAGGHPHRHHRRLRGAGADRLHDRLRSRLRLPEWLPRRRPDRRRRRSRRALRRLARQHVARANRRAACRRTTASRTRTRSWRTASGSSSEYHDPNAGLDDPDRAGALLALLRDRRPDARHGRAGAPERGEAAHPSLRDARRGALHAAAARAAPGRLHGDRWTGWATTSGTPTPFTSTTTRSISSPAQGDGRLPLPLLQHAPGLRHRAAAKYLRRRRAHRPRCRRLGQQRRQPHAGRGRGRRCCWRG